MYYQCIETLDELTHMRNLDKDDVGKTEFILICIDSHCFEKTVYHLFGPG